MIEGVTRAEALAMRSPRQGDGNPDIMRNRFWLMMIYARKPASWARQAFDIDSSGPTWCFVRRGRCVVQLRDQRILYIGGSHEDFYDPDFCIYNDVVVEQVDGTYEIFAYPERIFPPSDFQSATIVGHELYLIGSLGYLDRRRPGETQALALNLDTLRMRPVETFGDGPGWVYGHEAEWNRPRNTIAIWGGKRIVWKGDKMESEQLGEERYELDLATQLWTAT